MTSVTAVLWLGAFVTMAALALFRRSSWGIPLYLMTFYAMPAAWWWGRGLLNALGYRWNLTAALILAVGVFLDLRRRPHDPEGATGRVLKLLALYAINATIVHVMFTGGSSRDFERSLEGLTLLWKQVGLLFLMVMAIRDKFDLKLLMYAVIVGAGYIGYEVVVNGRGHFEGARLEGIIIPGAAEANYLAGLMCLSLVLGGGLLLTGTRAEKIGTLIALPMILDVVLRCNSRGAFLALIAAGVWLIWWSRGRIRRYAMIGLAMGGLAAFVQAGDPEIMQRFLTTFTPSEERDYSAQSRMLFWTLGMEMVADYPFGSGAGAAFKSDRGVRYMYDNGIPGYKAVHNGYIDIAASWGVQGLLIYGCGIFIAWRILRRATHRAYAVGDEKLAFLGVCIDAALITQLGVCMFISSLDGEWFFWWIAMALAYDRLISDDLRQHSVQQAAEAAQEIQPREGPPPEVALT